MRILPTLLVAGLVTGCSSFTRLTDVTNLVDYSDHKSVKVLEIPSDLDAPNFDKTYITTISDSMAKAKSGRLDRVPLVDKSMGPPSASTVKLVQQGNQVVMQIDETKLLVWKRLDLTLKAMGMTISNSDQASGVIAARDKTQVSDTGSPIGRFLNKTLGKVNKGKEYQFRVSGSGNQTSIEVADKAGKALPAADARLILGRLRKEYLS